MTNIDKSTLRLSEVDQQNTEQATRTVIEPNFALIKRDIELLADAINGITPGSGGGGGVGPQGPKGDPGADSTVPGPKGDKGDQGAQGIYSVNLFLRASTKPDTSPTDVTWTPPGTLSNTNSANWALTIPAGTDTLWMVTAPFNPASSATNITTWSAVFQAGSTGPAGATGPAGSQGDQGPYTVRLYQRSTNDVERPTQLTWTASTNGLSGAHAVDWSTDIPQGIGEPVWETNAVFDPAGTATTITAWGLPFRLTGEDGPAGSAGAQGPQGSEKISAYTSSPDPSGGASGSQSSGVTRPTQLTWTAATRALSGTDATTWRNTIPTSTDPIWETTGTYNPASSAGTVTTWSEPFRLTGIDGPTGPKGADAMLTATQTNKLGSITEVSSTTYDTMIGLIGFSPQFTINNFFSTRQQPSYTNGSTSSTFIMRAVRLWDVPMETDLSLLEWRVRRTDNEVVHRQAFGTFLSTRRTHMYDYEGDITPNISVAPGQTLYIARRDNIPTTYTLSTEYRVPARVVTDLTENALAPTNARKLGDVTESATVTYATLTGGTLAFNPSSGTPVFTSTLTSTSTGGPSGRVLFEVPTDTSLNTLFLRIVNSDGTLALECPLNGLTKQTSFSSGKDRYLTVVTFTLTTGQTARLQVATTTSDTFTLSDKYRVPASILTGSVPTGPTGPKGDKGDQGDRGSGNGAGNLTETERAALRNISEAGRTDSYAAIPMTIFRPASTEEGFTSVNLNNPATANRNATSTIKKMRVYAPLGTSFDHAYFRVTRAGSVIATQRAIYLGSHDASVSVAGVPASYSLFNINFSTLPALQIGDILSLDRLTASFNTFTLSSKYRVPASIVTDLPSGAGGLTPLNTRKLGDITEASSQVRAPLAGGQLAFQQGSIPGPFSAFLRPSTGTAVAVYLEVNAGTSLTNITLQEYDTEGNSVNIFQLNSVIRQATANPGKDRYLTNGPRPVEADFTLRIIEQSTQYDTYTLSDKYRLPVDGLVGSISANKVSSVASGNLVATTVQGALNELQTEIDGIPAPEEGEAFFDHVELTGELTNTAGAADFYYLPAASLPERDLTKWTHVTNSQFPQPTLTKFTPYVVLLNNGKYPHQITWNPASTQPVNPVTNAAFATIRANDFDQEDGLQVPEGYEGFRFLMPPWNAASTLLTGARLQTGDLTRAEVRRIDLSEVVKVTDNNLDISDSTTFLTENQREKLSGLHIKTYTQTAETVGNPNSDYKLLLASAWPDPDVDYSTFDPITNPTLGQTPSETGVRENRGGRTGLASFFNLVTDNPSVLSQPNPTSRGYNTLYVQQHINAPEYADCAGIAGGTIVASDDSANSAFRVDDGRGLFATMTLHIPPSLPNGSYPIMNIGSRDEDGDHALVLRKGIDNTYPPTTDLAVKRFDGPPTTTTQLQYRDTRLQAAAGGDSQIFRADSGLGQSGEDIPHTFIVPAALNATTQAPARMSMHIRVWNNNNDLGEHDFTSSLPATFRTFTSFAADIPVGINNPGGTDFSLPMSAAGFPGRLDVAANIRYDATASNEGKFELTFKALNNPAIYYEVRLDMGAQESVTIPGGRFREDVIAAGVPDGASEIGYYAYTTGTGSNQRMNYRAAINGRVGDLEVDDFSGFNGRVATGRVPVTFGHASNVSSYLIAVNRFAIFKPTGVLSVDHMNELTSRSERNRDDVGGLVRHAGGEYEEVFSEAYKTTMFTSGAAQNLVHRTTGSTFASTQTAVGVNVLWTNANTPKELTIGTTTSEITANTNFTASLTLDVGVLFDDSALNTTGSSRINPKSFLLLRATVQEKIGSANWTPVPGPELAVEMRAQIFDDGGERPAGLQVNGDALLRRAFNTVVNFKTGAMYRVRITGYRLSGESTDAGGWPIGDSVVQLAANQTYLMLNMTPTI